ncbi:MAG: hypothetical protein PHY08_09680 [Candidatus Cloacimonetes bacterium]|nr:hypothetical protein [Candidatus Cloacimonadota bacterium]MDD4156828.1 hypothetical protein [Candidatus Cloacimonadota bacterium]
MDKKLFITICLILLCFSLSANRNASLNISFTIPQVETITINDSQLNFNLNYSGQPNQLYEPRIIPTSYNITSTSSSPKRLLASLDQSMPNNVFLEVNAEAPTGAISLGYVQLDSSTKPIVTGITSVNEHSRVMNFRLSATLGAQVAINQNRVVTFTISD